MDARSVKCPRCGKPALFTPENSFRPFCSERCKLIDLGAWAEEKYAIPVKPATEAGSDDIDEESGTGVDPEDASNAGADEQNPHVH